ncbi:MAG: hypothetical protein CL949_11275 [Erythrobacter sp.]|nr:hypothetical protein [Erythrobacter sp.]
MTYEEVIATLETEFDGIGGEYHAHHQEELAGGWLFYISHPGNPFDEGDILTPTKFVSLSGRDTKYRSLRSGEYNFGSGWVAIWQDIKEAYGEFIDIPDDHEITAWIGPKEKAEEGRRRVMKDHDALLAAEVEGDLGAIERRLASIAASLPYEARHGIITRLTAIARNTL